MLKPCTHFVSNVLKKALEKLEIKARYLRDGKDPSERIGFILERSLMIDIMRRSL